MKTKIRPLLKTFAIFLIAFAATVAAGSLYYFWPTQKIPSNQKVEKIIVEKKARLLRVLSGGETIASYPVSLGRDPAGDKKCKGDNKTPEGEYILDWRNPGSAAYKSFHVSYPNPTDRRETAKLGCSPGGTIMIHGIGNGYEWIGRFHRFYDWTHGCIALTNDEMEQLWWAVSDGTPIEIRP